MSSDYQVPMRSSLAAWPKSAEDFFMRGLQHVYSRLKDHAD